MGKLENIKTSIEELSPEEQRALASWLEEYRERLFDEAIERDAKAGKLDLLMREAMEEHKTGRTTLL